MDSPHDKLFKVAFGDTREAAPLLRSMLPRAISATLNWPSLRVVPGTFVDKALKERRTDILYSAQTESGGTQLVYLVLEHQSSVDPMMAFRMYEYVALILGRWRRDHPKAPRLPQVIPLVLYAGGRPWQAATAVEDLVEGDTASWTPKMSFILDDLTQLSSDALSERALEVFGEVSLKMLKDLPRSADPVGLVMSLHATLTRLLATTNGLDRFVSVLEYLSRVANVELEDVQAVVRQVRPAAEETVMTTLAERMEKAALIRGREQGRERGLEEGRERGLEEGRRQARVEMTLLQLELDFGSPLPDPIVAQVKGGTDADFVRWMKRRVRAETLQQIFDDAPLD